MPLLWHEPSEPEFNTRGRTCVISPNRLQAQVLLQHPQEGELELTHN